MQYDFTTTVNRSSCGSFKWEQMKESNPEVAMGVIPFSVADMELLNPPEIAQGLQSYMEGLVMGYTGPTEGFYQAVISWMERRHNWPIEQEWLVQTGGVVSAFYNAVRVFSQPGDGVMMFTPVYYPFYSATQLQGRRQVHMPLVVRDGRYEMDFDLLEEEASRDSNKVLLFCSPHNPVGRVWQRQELERVADICLKHGVLIISDEIHFDLVMPGHRHTVMSTLSPEVARNTVVLTAPSKTFNLAGLQCSNAVIQNDTLRDLFQQGLRAVGLGMLNIFAYKACEIAYNQCEDWLTQLLALIDENQRAVSEHCKLHIPQVRVYPMEGTYLQWLDMNGLGLHRESLEHLLRRQAQVFMSPGHAFGPEGESFQRMNLAAPTAAVLAACQRLGDALSNN